MINYSMFLERAYDCRLSFAHDLTGLGTIVGSAINLGAQHLANETNLDIAKMNNETSIALAREANANQLKAMRENNKFNAEQAQIAREWDSPVALKGRLLEAGINPAMSMQGNLQSHSSAASASGSGISPVVPSLQQAHVEPYDFVGGIQGIASAIAQLSQAKKTDADANRVKRLLGDELELIHSNAEMAKYERFLQSMFAGQERNLGVQKLKVELAQGSQELQNLITEGDSIKFNAALTRQKVKSERILQGIHGLRKEIMQNELDKWFDTWNQDMSNKRAQAAKDRADAVYTSERFSQLKDMHDDIVKMQQWLTKKAESDYHLTDMDKRAMEKAFDTKVKFLRDHYSHANTLEQKQIQLAIEAVDKARYDNDYYHYNMALKTLESTISLLNVAKSPQGYHKEHQVTDKKGSYVETYTPWND